LVPWLGSADDGDEPVTLLRRPTTVALCTLAAFALAWPIAASSGSATSTDAREAARLVRGTRDAATDLDFTGVATITWTTPKGKQSARVHVSDVGGAVSVSAADGNTVVDEGRRTYLRDRLGWTGLVVEPTARNVPEPDQRWALATGGTRTVAGRPATVVLARRPGGEPAQRLAVDEATGLLLAREVLGPNGRVERSVQFSTIDVGERDTHAVSPPDHVRSESAEKLTSVPDGYRAPSEPAGFELVTRSRHPDGVLLFYSDGVFTASVFEQQGDLDWGALPSGGTDSQLADTRTRTYHEASGDVAVWERNGLVYTFVTDAPSDVFTQMVGALASDTRSTPEAVVDFVLDPFGWG
jgi:hypothetical protein